MRQGVIRVVGIGLSVMVLAAAGGRGDNEALGLRREIFARLAGHDTARAADLIEKYLQHRPDDAAMLYNAACLRCRLGRPDAAASYLLAAVKAGFRDFSHMRRDPDLRTIRGHPAYRAILDARDAADGLLAGRRLERWRQRCDPETYRFETDEQRLIHYVTALDQATHRRMRRMLEDHHHHLAATIFQTPRPSQPNPRHPRNPRNIVLIAVLAPTEAAQVFEDEHIHGTYRHGERELVTCDIDESLRHEFVHAMHHSHMDSLGQQHPLWIQEGLAALYESYEVDDDDSIVFLPNERRNIARSRARAGRLTAWNTLFKLDPQRLTADPGNLYAELRSIFEFLAEEGKLEAWYRSYVEHFDEDPIGTKAFELVFECPPAEVEDRWRRWLDDKPAIVGRNPVG